MSVLLQTSLGNIVVDLAVEEVPQACLHFLKLCKIGYYTDQVIFDVQRDFICQAGDPTATGRGGLDNIFQICGEERYIKAKAVKDLAHDRLGTVSLVTLANGLIGGQFMITLSHKPIPYLDGKHTVIGRVEEGLDVLEAINDVYVDDQNRPFTDVLILKTVLLDDPFPDPAGLPNYKEKSDAPWYKDVLRSHRLGASDVALEDALTPEERDAEQRRKEAEARALTLEMVGDLPSADMKPPENVLFVCKLNPVTRDEDLELIFSRFGKINSCEIIRNKATGDSLQYAFIEFDDKASCEEAYFKMDKVLIDDRRIHVDFSQSVSKQFKDWQAGRTRARYHKDLELKPSLRRRTQDPKYDYLPY